MKLRNKKTGKVIEWFINTDGVFPNSLAELNEEWEDYEEEPKRTWFIDTCCVPNYIDYGDNPITDHCYDDLNELGFCFETKEEAEKAVEKLKAWKRLKDNGITFSLDEDGSKPFIRIDSEKETGTFQLVLSITEDLDLLFGGEE